MAGETEAAGNPEPGDQEIGNQEPDSEDSRVLIAYFSRWGNTDYEEDVDATTSASVLLPGNTAVLAN